MKIVICEGGDDASVIRGLCLAAGLVDIHVEHYGGRGNFESFLRELPKRPEFTRQEVVSLGVTMDADTSGPSTWQKIQNGLRSSFGIELTARGEFVGDKPKIGGFVVGKTNDTGMLEDLCLQSVNNRPGYPCLDDYFRCLAEKTSQKEYHAKARFRAWMASQSEFDLRAGRAAEQGFLPWDSPAFEPLKQFLRAL